MNVDCFWNMQKILLHKINAEIHCKCRNLPTNTEDLVSMLFVGGAWHTGIPGLWTQVLGSGL